MCSCCKRMKNPERAVVENGTKSDYDVNFNGKESEKQLMENDGLLETEKPITKKGSAAIISNGLQANYRDSAVAMANSKSDLLFVYLIGLKSANNIQIMKKIFLLYQV